MDYLVKRGDEYLVSVHGDGLTTRRRYVILPCSQKAAGKFGAIEADEYAPACGGRVVRLRRKRVEPKRDPVVAGRIYLNECLKNTVRARQVTVMFGGVVVVLFEGTNGDIRTMRIERFAESHRFATDEEEAACPIPL